MTQWSRRQTFVAALTVAGATLARPSRQWRPASTVLLPDVTTFAVPVPTPFSSTLELDLVTHRRLLEFYRRAGAAAVLAVSACGEMLSISWPEALQLSRQAQAVFGSQRTWASVSRGDSVAACLRGIRELRSAGVGLPVVLPGLLADASVNEAEALQRLQAVARASGGALGLYEALAPYHRTLGPEQLTTLAQTGVYRLLKTTQERGPQVAALRAAAGGVRILEANTADLAAVLAAGADGVLDFTAAAFPEVVAALVQRWDDASQRPLLQRLCQWIGDSDGQFLNVLSFPRGVKSALALRGLPISPRSRQAVADLSHEQQAAVRELVRQFQGWCRDLGVTPLL